ncbi:hypothetical protein As57867_019139, partial [Aphanomyces stellatus]
MKVAIVLSVAAAIAHAKVSIGVRRALETSATIKAVVHFEAPNLNALPESSMDDRRQAVFDALTAHTTQAQTEATSVLTSANCQAYWIGSVSVCKGLSAADIDELAKLPHVKAITAPIVVELDEPVTKEAAPAVAVPEDAKPQWGVDTIGAPSIWKYFTGKGVVVGSIDTGAEYRHEAIKHNWRSNKGWFNPYNGTKVELPFDSATHGTHTIGTIAGSHGIGVAPGAQWISCLGLYGKSGDDESLLACAQFMVCPTRLDGTHPECKLGADVINNSWGGKEKYNPWFENIVTAWRAAGITPIFSNGNNGPACDTVGNPGGYNRMISVGAIGSYKNDPTQLAPFSSKGPNTIRDLNNKTITIIKPDVSAPGMYTLSADATNLTNYIEKAGTSMAAPHVAGVVALLKSAQSDLTYEEIYSYLTKTTDRDILQAEPETWFFPNGTVRAPGAPNCGGVSDKAWPNNRYGHGRVNVGTILRDGKLNDTPTNKPTPVATPAVTTEAPKPTPVPTPAVTGEPTTTPCPPLTPKPTAGPTPAPTGEPTTTPCPPLTPKPTAGPTPAPTGEPTTTPCPPLTPKPTAGPTPAPTGEPTTTPCPPLTPKPTSGPTPAPTGEPTTTPCPPLTPKPTGEPTTTPCPTSLTPKPTSAPTPAPTPATGTTTTVKPTT